MTARITGQEYLIWTGRLAGANANLISPTFDPENTLKVKIRIAGYSAAATARLQFNGDTGTTAYALSVGENTSAVTTQVSGVAAGIQVATTNQVARALIVFEIGNISGDVHGVVWTGSTNSEAAATAPALVQGAGIWTTTAQITQITLNVGSGGGTMNAGTWMAIYGIAG